MRLGDFVLDFAERPPNIDLALTCRQNRARSASGVSPSSVEKPSTRRSWSKSVTSSVVAVAGTSESTAAEGSFEASYSVTTASGSGTAWCTTFGSPLQPVRSRAPTSAAPRLPTRLTRRILP